MTYLLSSRQTVEAVLDDDGRGHLPGLTSPRTMVEGLPAVLQEDEFCVNFVEALDEVMAPIYLVIDCLDSYLDTALAPEDFVNWLASWVGIEVDETWSLDKRRLLVRNAVVLYRSRGTRPGLAAHLQLYTGVAPEVTDSGGCVWSQTADTELPGSNVPSLTVRLHLEDDEGVRLNTVSRIVAVSRPAHVPYVVEITSGGETVQALPDELAGAGEAAADAPGAVGLPGSESIELALQAPTIDEGIGTDAGTQEPNEQGES